MHLSTFPFPGLQVIGKAFALAIRQINILNIVLMHAFKPFDRELTLKIKHETDYDICKTIISPLKDNGEENTPKNLQGLQSGMICQR